MSEIKIDIDEDNNPLITIVFAFDGSNDITCDKVNDNFKLDSTRMSVWLLRR